MMRDESSWADRRRPRAAATLRTMQVGQHVVAVLLSVIGSVRAVAEGTAPALACAAAAVVLLWYAVGVAVPLRRRSRVASSWWLVGLTALWVMAVGVSAEFVWFAFVLWLLAGHLLERWTSIVFAVLVFAVVAFAPVAHFGTTSYANVFGPLIGGVFALGVSRGYLELRRDAVERERLVDSLRQAHAELAGLQDELALTGRQSGAMAERTRLSRDIHDTVAQGLSSIRLLARAELERHPEDSATVTLGQVEALAGDSLADVRRIVAELVPSELEGNALAAALRRMLERFGEETGIATDLRVDDTVPALPTPHEVALLRTAQSALANVRLHSGASRVVVSLVDAGDTVRLDVVDDGRGFDAKKWIGDETSSRSGFGLRFMRSRLREQGGGLELESSRGDGTALSAHVPTTASGKG